MLGRYYKGDPYRGQLYAPPVEFIAKALEGAQKQYDTNFAGAQGLKNKFIQSRTVDRARANQIEQEVNAKVDAIAKKYNGDYSQATKDLYALQSEISKLYGPGGEAGAIQSNLAAEQGSLKVEQERLAKHEITADQYNSLKDYYNQSPATTLDPNTGIYSQFQPLALNKYVNSNKIYQDTFDKVKPRSIERSMPTGRDYRGNIEFQTIKQTGIDPNEVNSAFQTNLTQDQEFMGYLTQTAQLTGQDPDKILQSILSDYQNNVTPLRTGVIDDSVKMDYKTDWQAQENLSYRHRQALQAQAHKDRKDEISFREALKNAPDGGSASNESFLTINSSAGSSFKPLGDWTKRVVPDKIKNEQFQDPLTRYLLGTEVPMTIQDALKDKRVNAPMLESIRKANPSLSEGDIFRLYDDRIAKPSNSEVYYTKYETTSAQQEAANRLMPDLLSGRGDVWKIDANTKKAYPIAQSEVLELAKKWQDDRNPLKSKVGSLGKSRVSSGHVPFGDIMPDPDNNGNIYVVKDNSTEMRIAQEKTLDPLFTKWLQDDSQVYSPPGLIFNEKGENSYIIGRKEYINGEMTPVYYAAPIGVNGQPVMNDADPYTVNGRYMTTREMENMIITQKDILSRYPRKTKTAYENEILDQ